MVATHPAPDTTCPTCGLPIRWVPGNPAASSGHWVCPSGDRWRRVGEHGALLPLAVAEMMGER